MALSSTKFPNLYQSQLSCSSVLISGSRRNVLASNQVAIDLIQTPEEAKEKIRKMLQKAEISASAYDTAWVAMAPSPTSKNSPCFPVCIDWIMENQMRDGSWGVPDCGPLLVKDTLSSTLACALALKKWSIGEDNIRKGLNFIVSNFASAMTEEWLSPIGFNVVFPCMIEMAIKMDINLHIAPTDIDFVLQKKDTELRRMQEKNSKVRNFFLAYISEALGTSQDWGMAMTYQNKNGSLFNSPSTTAAAFAELQDSNCYTYLCSVLQRFGNAVPALHPASVYCRLTMVDILENLGLDRHFIEDIRLALNETYRQWEQGHEEIFSDFITHMMAFRLLRHHGYKVSSESLVTFHGEDSFFEIYGGNLEDTRAAFELFKASHLQLYDHESYLEKHLSVTKNVLEGQISDQAINEDSLSKRILQEISHALKSPYYANLERLGNRAYIKNHELYERRVLKSSLGCINLFNGDLLQLAKDDFRHCQSMHLQEFEQLQRWVAESKLDQLTFSRQKLGYCYFSAAATIFPPELADARISWAKNSVLTTVVDDFFDVGSSAEEQLNLIQLLEQWEASKTVSTCSKKVQIIFSALCDTICEIGKKAHSWQDRDVTNHVVEIWLCLVKSMWIEAEMSRNKSLPTMGEYMGNAYTSFALGPIVLPALYFIGPKLSEQVVRSAQYQKLFELMSTCGRLLNDIQGFQREAEDGKLNAVSVRLLHGNGTISKEDAIRELRQTIDDRRRELLRLVLQSDDSVVPRDCKDVFWKMCKVVHLFYMNEDGFTSSELKSAVKSILYDPIDA